MGTTKNKPEEIRDELNPEFMFQTFETSLIVKIATGEINAQEFAAKEMASRGIDKNCVWVGFARAAVIWGVK